MGRRKKTEEVVTTGYNNIQVLDILNAIRKRPGMYIGDTTRGPQHLFNEVFDNALDEASAGHCDTIYIELSEDNKKLVIRDNGRGFPDNRNAEGVHDIVTSCTVLHSSGKFNHSNYNISIGTHGVGLVAVNAVSSEFSINSVRDGVRTIARFKDSVLDTGDVIQEKTKDSNGTEVTVIASPEVFKMTTKFDNNNIYDRLKLAVTFCNVKIIFNGEEIEPLSTEELAPKIETSLFEIQATYDKEVTDTDKSGDKITKTITETILLKFGYNLHSTRCDINRGSVNLLRVDSGAHIRVFEKALIEAWQSIVDSDTREYLSSGDYLIGLSGFVLTYLADPQYSSQTKESLSGSIVEYRYLINAIVPEIVKVLKSDKKLLEALITKFKDYRKNLNKLSTSNYLDEMIEMGDTGTSTSRKLNTESKLIDCSSKGREGTELYIAEGRSASGNLIPFRSQKFHAILPLRGKVKNVVDLDIKDIVSNSEIRSLLNAMGTGCFHKEDPERCRYEKIIIITDGDVDGASIQALLLGVFLFCTPKTLESGRVYIAEAPLFGQHDENNKFKPIWNSQDIDNSKHFDRFKGLGSMDAEELAMIAFDKSYRRLRQVTLDDAQSALKLIRSSSEKKKLMINKGILK